MSSYSKAMLRRMCKEEGKRIRLPAMMNDFGSVRFTLASLKRSYDNLTKALNFY